MNKTKIMALSALLLLTFASFSSAATFSFSSSSDTLIKGCPSQIDLVINTQGQETTVSEMVLVTNDQYEFNSFDATLGVFPTYTEAKMIADNHLKVLGTTAATAGYNGIGKFGTLVVTPTQDTLTLELYMKDGFAGADSNVFLKETSQDILTSVESKTFNVVEGTCPVAPQAAAEVGTADDVTVAVSTDDLGGVLEEVTSKNEAIVLPTTGWKAYLNYIYMGAGLLVLIILLSFLLRKKNTNKK